MLLSYRKQLSFEYLHLALKSSLSKMVEVEYHFKMSKRFLNILCNAL